MSQTEDPPANTPPAKKKSDLIPRLVTAVVAVPLLLALLFLAPPWGFAILIAAAIVIAAWEYTSITIGTDQRIAQVVTSLCALGIGAAMYLSGDATGPDAHVLIASFAGSGLLLFITYLAVYKNQEKVTLHLGSSAMALIYCGVLPGLLAMLRRDAGDNGAVWVLLAMAVVWGSDTGAYAAGRTFGKHKLAPRVSPKKSIEGAAGGLLSSIVAVFAFKYLALPELTIGHVFLLAIPANILGQVGDLCESLIKRAHKVKDSGTIVYGHGGLLDRIDALIFAVPWFYYFHRYFMT